MPYTQNARAPAEANSTPRTVCLVDDHLSVWISLEADDRMIALLETERRELTEELTVHGKTLELMEDSRVISEGFTMTQLGVLRRSETGSREVLKQKVDQIETRLAEVNKTLKRRRMQRARLEEWLNLYIGASPADGS